MSALKLAVISDGISQDPEVALRFLADEGIPYVDFQFVWGTEIGSHSREQVRELKRLTKEYGIKVGCLTRHNFNGIPAKMETLESDLYKQHMEKYQHCFDVAEELEAAYVRIMSTKKEMILFGTHGAENWVIAKGAWDAQVALYREPVEYAKKRGIPIVTENCNGGQVTSNFLARKLVEEFDTEILGILWDPANAMYCTETPYPDGYEMGRDYIRHIHLKDAKINIARATVEFRPLGLGDMGPYLYDIAEALRRDNYQGIVSLEANYRPLGKEFIDGTRISIQHFKRLFG